MARWLKYLVERSPPVLLALIAGGVTLSGVWMGDAGVQAGPFALVMGGVILFLVLARLMDERKDHEKDRVAHPERPLPRGLVSVPEAERAIGVGAALGIAYAVLIAVVVGLLAGGLFAAAIGYLWLMYREFHAAPWLHRHSLVNAVAHQAVVFPLYAFAIAVPSPHQALSRQGLAYVLCNMGASMAYEVGRKLDAGAHPALRTYAAVWGPGRAAAVVVASCVVATTGALVLGAGRPLAVVELLIVVAVAFYLRNPRRHRLVEAATGLASLLFIWIIPVMRLWGRIS
ncbi:MAG: UbiA family prenyltransferase [Bacteroidota bacterium]